MNITDLSNIPAKEVSSPNGKYRITRRFISQALGGLKDVGLWGGGHPFDVEHVEVAPGAANFPFHVHAAQWEMYVFLSGTGEVRSDEGLTAVEAGKSVLFKPGEAHLIRNTGSVNLVYLVIADNVPADVVRYPDSPGKLGIKPGVGIVTTQEVSYYEPGE